MQSQLSIQFYEDNNVNTLTLIDRSIYNPDITVECERLLITLPGFSNPITIEDITKGFNRALNTSDFKLGTYSALSDGLYIINYSICPNDDIYVEYLYLRLTNLYKKYYNICTSLDLSACAPTSVIKKQIDKLRDIEFYMKYAKSAIEDCGSVNKGLELYNYACRLLDTFKTNCKNCD